MLNNKNIYKYAKIAISKTIEENKKKNIPNVFFKNGRIVFQLPNGDIVNKYNFSKKI